MKLAEALLLRSDQQKQLASLKQRINANVLVQEGDTPSQDPETLIKKTFELSTQLHQLMQKIHYTNAHTSLNDGRLLLSVLLKRDDYIARHQILTDAIQHSHRDTERYSGREIKWQKVISVSALQKQADDISIKIREINILIQSANWQIDLIESSM